MHYRTIVTCVVLGRFTFSWASEETITSSMKNDEISALLKYRILEIYMLLLCLYAFPS